MSRENMDFFKDKDGNIKYNENCQNCEYDCKQSYKVKIVSCKKTKEGKRCLN